MCLPGLFHAKLLRGGYFRKEFQILGEVRSLIPPHVHIMGMTATATTTTRDRVISTLGLINPVVVSASPDKPNISYAVRQKVSIEEAFSGPLAVKLKTLRRKLPRMIIFCRRYEECTLLYHFFLSLLKNEFTQPVGAPNLAQFRLVDMYTSVTRKSVQESIVASFSTSDSPLRIVICAIAFGMGIDCVDVCQINKSSIGDHQLTWSHMYRSVGEQDETANQQMHYCFGKKLILSHNTLLVKT